MGDGELPICCIAAPKIYVRQSHSLRLYTDLEEVRTRAANLMVGHFLVPVQLFRQRRQMFLGLGDWKARTGSKRTEAKRTGNRSITNCIMDRINVDCD